ncbi:hypothetical protein JHK86_049931 [Glycine max]|nr:hypothetical protein JHK86_049931 [Glycine max]
MGPPSCGSRHQFKLMICAIGVQEQEQVDKKAIDGLNVYNILEPCYHFLDAAIAKENGTLPKSFKQLGVTERPLLVRKRMFGRAWPFRAPVKPGFVTLWPQLAQMRHVTCVVSYQLSLYYD